jgi:multiple sugar transport system ATP-binding protein
MVFQSYALYPHMTVYRNMAFGLKFARTEKAEIDRRVRHAAEILKLTPLLDRKPRELSGGQRQRVAIGRAIVRNPSVFLFDEPLSNLDAALRVNTRLEIAKLHRDLKATMIYVTHDQVEAMTLADKIVVLNGGRVEQVGAPLDLYHHPKNLFVAGFIGSPQMNFLPGRVVGTGAGGLRVEVADSTIAVPVAPGGLAIGDEVTLGIRPEHMDGPPGGAALTGTVEAVERLGEASFVYMRLAHGPMAVVRVSGEIAVSLGQSYTAPLPERHLHLFGPDGLALSRQESREAA